MDEQELIDNERALLNTGRRRMAHLRQQYMIQGVDAKFVLLEDMRITTGMIQISKRALQERNIRVEDTPNDELPNFHGTATEITEERTPIAIQAATFLELQPVVDGDLGYGITIGGVHEGAELLALACPEYSHAAGGHPKKAVKPAQKRELVQFLRVGFKVSQRRACQVIGSRRSSYRYVSTAKDQTLLKMRLRDLAAARVRYGYRRLHVLLRREGWQVNHKRVYRLYRLQGLSLRLKTRKKRVSGVRAVQPPPTAPNQSWSMDFMSDSLYDGRRFRLLTLVDTMSRESPLIAVERSFSGEKVAELLDQVAQRVGLPQAIQVDNSPEFTSKALDEWAQRNKVKLIFSRPGTPTDNPYIEAFTGRLRDECLDQHWFASLEDARRIIEAWWVEYNTERPHTALNNQAPAVYRANWERQQQVRETG